MHKLAATFVCVFNWEKRDIANVYESFHKVSQLCSFLVRLDAVWGLFYYAVSTSANTLSVDFVTSAWWWILEDVDVGGHGHFEIFSSYGLRD